jgi:hypothetical protein
MSSSVSISSRINSSGASGSWCMPSCIGFSRASASRSLSCRLHVGIYNKLWHLMHIKINKGYLKHHPPWGQLGTLPACSLRCWPLSIKTGIVSSMLLIDRQPDVIFSKRPVVFRVCVGGACKVTVGGSGFREDIKVCIVRITEGQPGQPVLVFGFVRCRCRRRRRRLCAASSSSSLWNELVN